MVRRTSMTYSDWIDTSSPQLSSGPMCFLFAADEQCAVEYDSMVAQTANMTGELCPHVEVI
jgi:hypothetical protein